MELAKQKQSEADKYGKQGGRGNKKALLSSRNSNQVVPL